MKVLTMLAACVVLAAACGRAPLTGPQAPGDRLYEAVYSPSGPLVDVIDSRSHDTLGTLPLGVASADWKHYYAVQSGELVDINPHSGAILHKMPLSRGYEMPRVAVDGMTGGLSEDGRWLVLEVAPIGAQSHLLVVSTSFTTPAVHVDLDGNFQFDGISDNGANLFLLHYLQGSDYQVRLFHVAGGYLDPQVIVDKNDPTEPMTGQRLDTVVTPGGNWQYTVYAREKKGAFIHALSLSAPFSLCIDLPGAGWSTDPTVFHWSLVISHDGSVLYAVNGALGMVVELNASSPQIQRIHVLPKEQAHAGLIQSVAAKEVGSGEAAVTPDGRRLVMIGATGIEWLDTSTLQPSQRALAGWTVWSLALGPDGRRLYTVRDSGQIAAITGGGAVADTFDPKAGQPLALMWVEASQ